MRTHYRHYGRKGLDVPPLPSVPHDYDKRLKNLRHTFGLTQESLAHQIGAANKAVVYQWESRQRTPSPVFWQRVETPGVARAAVATATTPMNANEVRVFMALREPVRVTRRAVV
jgi:hypothetical protein